MEGAVLSTPNNNNNRFRTHLKNAASALCARTLPRQWRMDVPSSARHHTYPRTTPPKRVAISCGMETSLCAQPRTTEDTTFRTSDLVPNNAMDIQDLNQNHNEVVKPIGCLAREVESAWGCRVGSSDQPAPADRVQSLFNDIELYPTKTQVFEMLVCARKCARRKSLTLTFGEFCVFAAELRRCSRQARQTTNKPDSPQWSTDKEHKELRHKEFSCKAGSEASPPPCEVFLGGSCNPTTWRSDIAIPILKKMGITYFNPQVEVWTTELMEVEHRAKAAARALLFVLDSETRTVAASVEAAHLAAAPRDLLLVLRPYSRHQLIGNETISDQEYVELTRARATLQEAVERRGLPAFTDIPTALRCARAVLRGARTHPRHSLGHAILRLKRVYDGAGGRAGPLPRARALDALRDVTRAPRDTADAHLPPDADAIDFETFCAAVAELATDYGLTEVEPPLPAASPAGASGSATAGDGARGVAARVRRALSSLRARLAASPGPLRQPLEAEGAGGVGGVRGAHDGPAGGGGGAGGGAVGVGAGAGGRDVNGLRVYNDRLRAYGRKLRLFIPKNGCRTADASGEGGGGGDGGAGGGGGDSSGDSVFTPGTEQRLERLPAMLGAPTHDVYLGGSFPSDSRRPEETLRAEGFTYVVPRANDYTRMFSAPARRAAPPGAHPDSPHRDKKPRPAPHSPAPAPAPAPGTPADDVQLRDRSDAADARDRLSASDFYRVTEDVTPQPFKGTYDSDLLLGSRVLVFSLSAEAPCFAAMVLAAHYMGLRPSATVLLVQPMRHDPDKHAPYSEAAVKDYNRGRTYLADLARRSGVPVFADVDAAMTCVISRLRAAL